MTRRRTAAVVAALAVIGAGLTAQPRAARATEAELQASAHAGFGFPGGSAMGLGLRYRGWQLRGELGIVGVPFLVGVTATAHLDMDLGPVGRAQLYLGVAATRSWWTGGSDEVIEFTVAAVGPKLGARWRFGRFRVEAEGGVLVGVCDGCNEGDRFVGLQATARLVWPF